MTRALPLLALLSGCLSGADIPGCGLPLVFDGTSRDFGRRAVVRMNAATGCHLHEASNGVPVSLVPVVRDEQGVPVCGGTTLVFYNGEFAYVESIRISTQVPGCVDADNVALHEFIHAMTGGRALHSKRGVYAGTGGGYLLEETSLAALCEHVACPRFVPEGER